MCRAFSVRTRNAAPDDAGLIAATADDAVSKKGRTGARGAISMEEREDPPVGVASTAAIAGGAAGFEREWAAPDPSAPDPTNPSDPTSDTDTGARGAAAGSEEKAAGGRLDTAAGSWRLAASLASSSAYLRSTASALEMKTGSASCAHG